jgi:hypothetical protein
LSLPYGAVITNAVLTRGVERQTLHAIVNKTNPFKFNPQVKVGNAPTSVNVNSITNKIYVTNSGSNTVFLIDTSNQINKSTLLDYAETNRKMSSDTMLRYRLDAKHSYTLGQQIIINFTLDSHFI